MVSMILENRWWDSIMSTKVAHIAKDESSYKKQGKLQAFQKGMKRYWPFYVMLLPCLIYYIIFKYGPMYGVVIAFKDFNVTEGIVGSPWADPWYKHYQYFFNSPYASQVIGNTLIISGLKLFFRLFPSLLLALLINECSKKWFGRVIQTLSYLPHFLSWVIIYGILIALFSQSAGLINRLIVDAGGKAYPVLTSPEHFRAVLVGSEIWRDTGWGAIIYLAAIGGIDPNLYEAAIIDGCGRIKRIWYITIPNLTGVFIMQLILKVGSILDAGFDQIYILSTPQVNSVSEIIDTWVFKEGLQRMNYSLASAVGLLKSVIGMIMVLSTNKLARRWDKALW